MVADTALPLEIARKYVSWTASRPQILKMMICTMSLEDVRSALSLGNSLLRSDGAISTMPERSVRNQRSHIGPTLNRLNRTWAAVPESPQRAAATSTLALADRWPVSRIGFFDAILFAPFWSL